MAVILLYINNHLIFSRYFIQIKFISNNNFNSLQNTTQFEHYHISKTRKLHSDPNSLRRKSTKISQRNSLERLFSREKRDFSTHTHTFHITQYKFTQ